MAMADFFNTFLRLTVLVSFACLASFMSAAGPLSAQDVPGEVNIHRDMVYKTVDTLDLHLSLVIPNSSNKKHKLLVILPDETMDKRFEYESLAFALADSGFISLIVDYRQPPDYSYPGTTEDILDAMDWIRAHSGDYEITIKSIGLIGQNFGGYTASITALKHPERIQAVFAIHSPMDLTTYSPPWGYPYRYNVFVGEPLKAAPAEWKSLSPVHNVKKSSPSFLLLHGGNDERVPLSQSLTMESRLKAELASVRLISPGEAGNGYFLADSHVTETAGRIINFANRSMVDIPVNIEIKKDLVYAEIDGKKLHMDMFRPRNANRQLPAVLFFHGGGWVWGRKEHMTRYAAELASHGFTTFTVEYRLAREAIYPACVDDAKAAVRWVRSRSMEFNIDPGHIGVAGQSAGGHIAAMLGVTNNDIYLGELVGPGNQTADVQAVATLSGVVDMLALYPRDPLSLAVLFGKSPRENKNLYIDASPVNRVSGQSSPFLFIHGTEDHLGLIEEMVAMENKLNNYGVNAETLPIEGGNHAFETIEMYRKTGYAKLVEFMSFHLKSQDR